MKRDERTQQNKIEDKYKILKIEVGELPYVKEIGKDLRDLQAEVDGLIEIIYDDGKAIIIANEEGKINGSKPNRRFGKDIIVGNFFIMGESEDGEFCSIGEKEIKEYTNLFSKIEEFTGEEEELEPRIYVIEFKNKY